MPVVDSDLRENRFDECMRLADFWAGRHDQRREFEWKISLGLWAAILAGIISADKLAAVSPALRIAVSGAVFLAYCGLWLYPLWRRSEFDKGQVFHFVRVATTTANLPQPKIRKLLWEDSKPIDPPLWKFFLNCFALFHITITVILLVLLNFVLQRSGHPSAPTSVFHWC